MQLDHLEALSSSVEGATITRATDDTLLVVRAADGVEARVKLHSSADFDRYKRTDDRILCIRWTVAAEQEPEVLSELNAKSVISIATANRYENLYGKSGRVFYRAQLLANGLEPERLMHALAADFGLRTTLPAPPPVDLALVLAQLNTAPVKTAAEELFAALLGGDAPGSGGSHYERVGDLVRGPSSIGQDSERSALPITVRLDPLGLVRVRHTRALRGSADSSGLLTKLNQLNSENSSDEECVAYVRAFLHATDEVAVEFTASFAELASELFPRKMRSLEIAVRSYLA